MLVLVVVDAVLVVVVKMVMLWMLLVVVVVVVMMMVVGVSVSEAAWRLRWRLVGGWLAGDIILGFIFGCFWE